MSGNNNKHALPGDLLLVVHEFVARSPDELSLAKGDRIELVERDDDFGDGWFLGKHLQTGLTGLFPEVYTTPAPKPTVSNAAPSRFGNGPFVAYSSTLQNEFINSLPPAAASSSTGYAKEETRTTTPPVVNIHTPSFSPPTQFTQQAQYFPAQPESSYKPQAASSSYARDNSHNSTVINETLNVIDEHITNMSRPSLSVVGGNERRPSNDSGSQYSTHLGLRPTYINGEETDEEEGLTQEEVMSWSPVRVAEYFEKSGVEKIHCEVFQEEEFSGDVILGLDQSTILLQELRLGSIGRRMKTWQKIRALQDEVKSSQTTPKRPRTCQGRQPSQPKFSNLDMGNNDRREFSAPAQFNSPTVGQHSSRPSAASIRDLAHSRRQSSVDMTTGRNYALPDYSAHGKQASFDRTWTMNGRQATLDQNWMPGTRQPTPNNLSRPISTVHMQSVSTDRAQFDRPLSTFNDLDRGYLSGGELDVKRQRTPLPREEPTIASAQPAEGRKRASTLFWKSSRPPSPEKRNDFGVPPRPQDSIRIVSEPVNGNMAPTVTKLAYGSETPRGDRISESPVVENNEGVARKGFRAISDAITGREKAYVQSPVDKAGSVEGSLPATPTLAGSSTPSVTSKDMDLEDANKSEFSSSANRQITAAARRKSKKSTSAYTRGLQKKSPQEMMVGSDYSGWMKKKSSNLMTTWKPRLFVLHGRRLSYYYSENDKEEKGLIDISNHRVLPADNDFITGLHATITGAHNSSNSNASSPSTTASSKAGTPSSTTASPLTPGSSRAFTFALRDGAPLLKGDNQPFIFKLVPPRSGLSKAVNFTKPTVHYFAVPSLQEGRLWMAALMKATIDRDESKKVITTYQKKTISLEKARARRERPPGLKEVSEEETVAGAQEEDDDDDDEGIQNDGIDSGGRDGDRYRRHADTEDSPIVNLGALQAPQSLRNSNLKSTHQQGPSQSMSFVSSLERQNEDATGTANTPLLTPSGLEGGGGVPEPTSAGAGYRKWSFDQSRRESENELVTGAGPRPQETVGEKEEIGDEGGVSAQGLGIHGVVRVVGTW